MDDHWPRYLGLLLDSTSPDAATDAARRGLADHDLDAEVRDEPGEVLGRLRQRRRARRDLLRRG